MSWRLAAVAPQRARRWVLLGAAALGVGILGMAALGQQASQPPLRPAQLTLVVSSSVLRSVNKNDVVASARIWLDLVAKRRGFQVNSSVVVTDSQEELRKHVDDGSTSLAFLDAFEYLNLPRPELLPTLMTSSTKGERNYLLLVRRDDSVSSLEHLRGKKIAFYSWSDAQAGRKWLEVMLHDLRLGRAESFLGPITSADKPSAACLPVFFKKLDGCVIDQPSFELLNEMNPQIGKQLRVLATSPRFLEALLAVHANHQEHREDLIRGLLELHQDPEGRQILLVFRSDRMSTLTSGQLDTVRELRRKYLTFAEPQAAPPKDRSLTGWFARPAGLPTAAPWLSGPNQERP